MTLKETKSITEFEVKVRKSKAPDGSPCGPASATFSLGGP